MASVGKNHPDIDRPKHTLHRRQSRLKEGRCKAILPLYIRVVPSESKPLMDLKRLANTAEAGLFREAGQEW
jgi:hypothetical protein